MIYQVVQEGVNHFQELKDVLKIDAFSFRPDGTGTGKYRFCCFKEKLPIKNFPLKEMEGITVRENDKTVMICGGGPQIIDYLKKTMDFTLLNFGLEG